jgi:hypothetical protein
MSSVFLGMKTDQIHEVMQYVDSQAEEKLEETLTETVKNAKVKTSSPVDKSNVYLVANQIALAAYKSFENWAAQTFTASPSKELAEAWVKASFHHFGGAKSIQKKIRQELLA